MNKYRSLLAVGITAVFLILVGFVTYRNSVTATPVSSNPSKSTTYTLADVAKHHSQDDCWAAVNGRVYDLTS